MITTLSPGRFLDDEHARWGLLPTPLCRVRRRRVAAGIHACPAALTRDTHEMFPSGEVRWIGPFSLGLLKRSFPRFP